MAARRRNSLAGKKSTVSLTRNGLTIQVDDIPASDCALVAQALLDAMRQMVAAGYEELVVDAGGLHSGPLGTVDDTELEARRVGFR